MSNTELWKKTLSSIENKTNPVSFSAWFSPCEIYKIEDNIITILVPMSIHKKMLGDNYYSLLEDTLFDITNINYELKFVLKEDITEEKSEILETVSNKDIINNNKDSWETHLLPNLNFDNFVVGDTNRFAKTAALAVAEQPGKIYNPLFIYGKSGIGKTHLMHAIGNYITEHTDLKVLYTTSDNFQNEFTGIASVSKNESSIDYANNFKNKYRNVDVLIIDDIQYLVNGEKTKQEFFHTFNALHQSNKQIIISSDRSPDDLKLLEERLRSRFSWGLPVDIYPPDFDLRRRIIKSKIARLDIAKMIDEDVIEYIANTFENDVRILEGAINRLVAYTAMAVPKKIDLAFANEALKDVVNKNIYQNNDIGHIQKVVADYYNLTVENFKSKKRSANIAYPRQIAMYLCRMLTDESLPRIGLEFGGRDHSTVIYANKTIEQDLKKDEKLKDDINKIKAML